MPWTSSIRPLVKRVPTRPLAAGGHAVADMPDPNSGIENYARNTAAPASTDLGIGLMRRGMATSQANDTAHAADSFQRGVLTNIVARDPKWQGLFQALAEAGANHVRTGAAARWDDPGFFDTQDGAMSRTMNTMSPRERLLLNAMRTTPNAT